MIKQTVGDIKLTTISQFNFVIFNFLHLAFEILEGEQRFGISTPPPSSFCTVWE